MAGWFVKAADYIANSDGVAAFVTTNSICQGQSVPILWPVVFGAGCDLLFAYTSFKWANLASHNTGVTVAVVGIGAPTNAIRRLYEHQDDDTVALREGTSITPYLTIGPSVTVEKKNLPMSGQGVMEFGNKSSDGGNLLLSREQLEWLELSDAQRERFSRRIYGSSEFINGIVRFCIWIEDEHLPEARTIPVLERRIEAVRKLRLASPDKGAHVLARRPHQLKLMRIGEHNTIVVPRTSSESRPFLPNGLIDSKSTVTSEAFALYDAPLWNMALIASRLHLVWIATVCGKLETRYRYSNTLGWNTFPVPALTAQNKADLTECAENILLAREAHFPATIAELYHPDKMPDNLRHAHARNDEVLERIYVAQHPDDADRVPAAAGESLEDVSPDDPACGKGPGEKGSSATDMDASGSAGLAARNTYTRTYTLSAGGRHVANHAVSGRCHAGAGGRGRSGQRLVQKPLGGRGHPQVRRPRVA